MTVTRGELAALTTTGRDPLGILRRQNSTREQWLIPLRMARMAQSPFTFYRGTAALMAADQARDPHSGIPVVSSGDAHLSNFGFYATPQRTQAFDLNDFDESAWAPWEWDLKRLVTSVIIGGRDTDRSEKVVQAAAADTVRAYVSSLRTSDQHSPPGALLLPLQPGDGPPAPGQGIPPGAGAGRRGRPQTHQRTRRPPPDRGDR